MLLFYGNCQIYGVAQLFKKAYPEQQIITYSIASVEVNEIGKVVEAVSQCDALIYHPIVGWKNPELNTPNLMQHLKPDCIKISVQNLFFSPYYPEPRAVQDTEITSLMLEKVKEMAGLEFVIPKYDGKSLVESWTKSETQRQVDRQFDLTMTDWLLENYKKEKLFMTPNHCVNSVFFELMRRINARLTELTGRLQFPDLDSKIQALALVEPNFGHTYDIPIMQEVADTLGLEFDTDSGYIPHVTACTRREYLEWLKEKLYPETNKIAN